MITIAIPIYNSGEYLRYAIQSCINQTYQKWTLLLMCDGSTDNSTAIAYEMAEKDKRIKVINDGINRGLVYRLNQSIQMSTSKYYARMDADDIMHPKRLETQLNILVNNKDIDVLGSSAYSINENNEIRGIKGRDNNSLRRISSFIHPSILGKTEWFKTNKYNILAERFEDYELWQRTLNFSSFYKIETPLLYYREFGGSYYKKYYRTFQTSLQYLYKEANLSVNNKLYYLQFCLKCFLKSIVYKLYSIVKKEDKLIRERFKPLHHDKICEEANFYLKKAISYNKNEKIN